MWTSFRRKFTANYLALIIVLTIHFFSLPKSTNAGEPIGFNFAVSHISTELGHPAINSVYREKSGNLWIATQDGLYSYNGLELVSFDSHQKGNRWIPDSNTVDIVENEIGDLFIRSYTLGVFVRKQGTKKFVALKGLGVDGRQIHRITTTSNQYAVIAHDDGLTIYDHHLRRLVPVNIDEAITGIVIVEADASTPGRIAFSTREKTYTGQMDSDNASVTITGEFNGPASALAFDDEGTLFAGTAFGTLWKTHSEAVETPVNIAIDVLRNFRVSDIEVSDDGILIATDGGLFFSKKSLNGIRSLSTVADNLSSTLVNSIYLDQGYVWISSLGGLDLLSRSDFTRIKLSESYAGDITSLAEAKNGDLWVATYSGLWLLKSEQNKAEKFIHDEMGQLLKDERITTSKLIENNLWLGTAGGGLEVLDTRENLLTRISLTPTGAFVNDIEIVNGTVWVATADEGVFFGSKKTGFIRLTASPVLSFNITKILQYDNNRVLLLSENQAYFYDFKQRTITNLELVFGAENIKPVLYSVKIGHNGFLWIGTKNHGLYFSKVPKLSPRNTLFLEPLTEDRFWRKTSSLSIEVDSIGTVWFATDKGILSVEADGSNFSYYAAQHGLPRNPFNLNSSILRKDGSVAFGGLRGLTVFNPRRITPKDIDVPIKIVGVMSNGNSMFESIPMSMETINHRFGKGSVGFYFHTLDFVDTNLSNFRHKLTNHDKTWIENGNKNSATYTNLAPGDYTFHVQAANSSGIWNNEGASIQLRVLPPPWLTWWAYCLYAMLGCLLIWVGHRIYYSFVIDRRAKSLAFEMHLAEERADDDMQFQIELQQSVVQSAYDHNKSTLSLVEEILKKDAESVSIPDAKQKLRLEALADIDECLFFQAGERVVNVYKLTELIFQRVLPTPDAEFEGVITINDTTRELVDSYFAAPIALILLELVENASNNAFEEDSPVKFVQVHFSRSPLGDEKGDYWTLRVSDNGKGFGELPWPAHSTSSGLGLVKRLVENLNGTIDLSNGEGATIEISLPGITQA